MTELHTRGMHCAIAVLLSVGSAVAADDESGSGPAPGIPGATIGRMGDSAAVDPDEFSFSEAESSLWLSDHLKNIQRPGRLYYEFIKAGSFEQGFTDAVYLDILKLNGDGTKNVDLHFFTGEREQPFSPDNVTEIRGNPVVGLYLRGDVHDMNRLTNGNWRHFQRRIKLSLAEGAAVEAVSIEFDGKMVDAKRFTITPYVTDPHMRQFQKFAGKRYEFTLSEKVPGTLYEIRTVIPGTAEEHEPLIEERLTLKQVEYRS